MSKKTLKLGDFISVRIWHGDGMEIWTDRTFDYNVVDEEDKVIKNIKVKDEQVDKRD